jgi:hypothetical protein
MGLRLFGMNPDGTEPAMIFLDQRVAHLGIDVLPTMRAYPKTEAAEDIVNIASGSVDIIFGQLSGGLTREVLTLDGRSLSVRMEAFNGRGIAGVLLSLRLPIRDPEQIASLTVDVTGSISRTGPDSFFRLALRNFIRSRFDSALEIAPADTNLHTWTFRSASLAHVDRNGEIRLEVIGDVAGLDPTDLRIDHIGVKIRRHASR